MSFAQARRLNVDQNPLSYAVTIDGTQGSTVIFSRTSQPGETWQVYTATFTAAISGPATLGFHITTPPDSNDDTIFIDAVSVTVPALPTITSVVASHSSIWPPNKKMVPVTLTVAGNNLGSNVVLSIVSVTTNEPDGKQQWQITGPLTLNLLADRLGTGTGRVYTITVEATDSAGDTSTATTTVTVPHDQGN